MTERTITNKSLTDDDYDSISVTSTQESEVDEDATYVVDRILAEEEDDEGTKLYLIRWEGYPLLQSTWEPAENIQMHETFDKWEAEKDQIKRGIANPFDIADFVDQLRELLKAKEERHRRRRAKRKRLGIPVSPSGSDPEDTAGAIKKDDTESSDEATEVREEPEDDPGISSRAKRSTPISRSRQNVEASQDDSDISEDSLLEELVQKALKRPSSGVVKRTGNVCLTSQLFIHVHNFYSPI
jgi:chromo domain-containing protein 1